METLRFDLIWTVLQVIVILVSGSGGAKVHIYRDRNYSQLLLEVSLTDECYNVPDDKLNTYSSVITDTCVILYWTYNCKSAMSRMYMPGIKSLTEWGYTSSLQKCDDQEGGSELNVDITTYFRNSNPPILPNILESYYDVCRCINVPKYVKDMNLWSIDNHHNGLFAYFEPDCTEETSKALYIDAGHWTNSREMHSHSRSHKGSTVKIQSFGPAPNSTYFQQSCSPYSNDEVMKFEMLGLNQVNSTGTAIILRDTPSNLTMGANDDLMHFFADNVYQGFHFGSRSISKCNNFPKPVQQRWVNGVGSIQTRTCVILYSTEDCVGRSVKIEAPGSPNLTSVWETTVKGEQTLSSLYTQYPNWKWETKSYHVCNKYIGGPSLNVDIVSSDPKMSLLNKPVIFESYRNLCTCRNVPQYIQQLDRWSIENNGNQLIAYFTLDCFSSDTTPSPLIIPAGHSSFSFGLGLFEEVSPRHGGIYKIQSFGPDPNSKYFQKSCNRNGTSSLSESDIDGPIVKRMRGNKSKLRVLVNKFHDFSRQVNELGPIHEEAAFKLENAKNDLNKKLQEQINELQYYIDSLASHIDE